MGEATAAVMMLLTRTRTSGRNCIKGRSVSDSESFGRSPQSQSHLSNDLPSSMVQRPELTADVSCVYQKDLKRQAM